MTDNRVKLSACLLLLLVCFDLQIQNAESLNLMADLARKLQIARLYDNRFPKGPINMEGHSSYEIPTDIQQPQYQECTCPCYKDIGTEIPEVVWKKLY